MKNLSKIFSLIGFLILSSTTLSNTRGEPMEPEISLNLQCVVTSLKIMVMTPEGPKEFEGWEGGHNVGDPLNMVITRDKDNWLNVSLIDGPRKRRLTEDMFDFKDQQIRLENPGIRLEEENYRGTLIWTETHLVVNSMNQKINLKRYTESEWRGFMVDGPYNETVSVTSIVCETITNELLELIPQGNY